MEDSSQESFKAQNSPFCIRGAVMGFHYFPLTQKKYNKEGPQGAIPYTLPPTNLLISLLPAPQLAVKRTIWKGLKV